MKQPILYLNTYREPEPFDYAGWNSRAKARFRSAQIRWWIATVVDTVTTLAITGCTVFCCYLALTMM